MPPRSPREGQALDAEDTDPLGTPVRLDPGRLVLAGPGCRDESRPWLDPLEERCLLSLGSPWLFDTGAPSAAVAIGDVNGDGLPDVVTATTAGGINIALGNGDGTFEQSATIALLATSLSSLTLADLDGQHGLDIIAADPDRQ